MRGLDNVTGDTGENLLGKGSNIPWVGSVEEQPDMTMTCRHGGDMGWSQLHLVSSPTLNPLGLIPVCCHFL